MLFSIVKLLRSMVLEKVEKFFDKYIFKTAIRAMTFGFILTVLVQSSSITTSTIVPLAGAGVLTLRQIFPFTLGANIGTTVTSLMAALVLNPIAMVVAFSHLLFNIVGIIAIYPIKQIREIPLYCAETLANLSLKNRLIPLLYLAVVFVIIPLIIIILIGG
jgi:sodium-dependent phosphate cotransporter